MSLYRRTGALDALNALDRADKIAEQSRLEKEASVVSDKDREESRKFDEEHGLTNATIAERIKYVQEKILTTTRGHLLSNLAPVGEGIGAAEKKASPKTHGHQECVTCREACVRLYDKTRSTAQEIIWIDRVKCIHCGLEQPFKKELSK